jgi:hypothetical protein
MSDQAPRETRATPVEKQHPAPPHSTATSVANPRRTRLTRLGEDAARP